MKCPSCSWIVPIYFNISIFEVNLLDKHAKLTFVIQIITPSPSPSTEANLHAVKAWLDRSSTAHDWTTFFRYLLRVHQTSESELSKWENRLCKVLGTVPLTRCDANDPNCPVLSGPSNEYERFTDLPLNEQLIREALEGAGISPDQINIESEKIGNQDDLFADYYGGMIVSAIKSN